MLILLIVLFMVNLLYIFEVRLGSATSIYDCEIGNASSAADKTRISTGDFFGKMLPLLLASIGAPLLFTQVSLGLGLLLLALVCFAGTWIFGPHA
ncbi:MAG: hypothetical protein M0P73_00425 [Syntrophobacterales bacterium]|nr:hypothetical protein [Syntrophobacterales bacterium]